MAWDYNTNQVGLDPSAYSFGANAAAMPMQLGAAAAPGIAAPASTGLGDWLKGLGGFGQIGGNSGSAGLLGLGQLGLSGIGTIGNLWTSMGAMDLAKQQFNFQKEFAQKNLTNQTQSYNTALSDRARSRYAQENNPGGADAYVAANKLNGGL